MDYLSFYEQVLVKCVLSGFNKELREDNPYKHELSNIIDKINKHIKI